uniref:Uncharacterized protein n=1 Tax=Mycolicibacterium phage phi1_186018 TaxID=3236641 RepID=A0AB39AKK2_9CAUD
MRFFFLLLSRFTSVASPWGSARPSLRQAGYPVA